MPRSDMTDYRTRVAEIFADDLQDPPFVNQETLEIYLEHLNTRLDLPVSATYLEPSGGDEPNRYAVELIDLVPAEEHPVLGPQFGLLCEITEGEEGEPTTVPLAQIRIHGEGETRDLIQDYARWYWDYRN